MLKSQYHRPTILLWSVASFVVAIALAGCGNRRATVEGTVTLDGTPVAEARIVFEPADGNGPTAGGRIKNGRYRLSGDSGVDPGIKTVRISGTRSTGRKVEAGPPSPPGTMVDEIEHFIPSRYNRDSKLSREVVAGTNSHDFQLTTQAE